MAKVIQDDRGVRLVVDPDENIIIGSQRILKYLGIDSLVTLYNWVELYGLPAIKRPDGMWMTSMTSIDTWIFLAAAADLENRTKSRGGYRSHEKQIRHIEKIFGKDSPQAEFTRKSHAPGNRGQRKSGTGDHTHYSPKNPKPNKLSEGRQSLAKAGEGTPFDQHNIPADD